MSGPVIGCCGCGEVYPIALDDCPGCGQPTVDSIVVLMDSPPVASDALRNMVIVALIAPVVLLAVWLLWRGA